MRLFAMQGFLTVALGVLFLNTYTLKAESFLPSIDCKAPAIQNGIEAAYQHFQTHHFPEQQISGHNFGFDRGVNVFKPKNAKSRFFEKSKHHLLEHSRATVLKKLLDSRIQIGSLGGIDGIELSPISLSCQKLDPKYQKIFTEYKIKENEINSKVIPNLVTIGNQAFYSQYEAWKFMSLKTQFVKKFLLSGLWQKKQYLPFGVNPFHFAFPNILPVHSNSTSIESGAKRVFPHEFLNHTYANFPELIRPVSKMGLPLNQLDEAIFELEFSNLNFHTSFFRPDLEVQTFAEIIERVHKLFHLLPATLPDSMLSELRNSIPPQGDYFAMDYNQRLYVFAWEYFLEKEWDVFLAKILHDAGKQEGSVARTESGLKLISKVYNNWQEEIHFSVAQFCSMDHDGLQEYRHLPGLHFSTLDFTQTKSDIVANESYYLNFAEVGGYCSEPWKSSRKMAENVVRTASVPFVAMAMLTPGGKSLKAAMGLIASIVSSSSFISDAAIGFYQSKVMSPVENPSKTQRVKNIISNFYKSAMGILLFSYSGQLISKVQSAIEAGTAWKYLNIFSWSLKDQMHFYALHLGGNAVSAYRYIRSGENPFKRREYLVGFISGTIGMFALKPVFHKQKLFDQSLGILMYFGTTILVDETYQGIMSFIQDKEFDEKVAEFNMAWSVSLFFDFLITIRTVRAIEKAIEKSSFPNRSVVAGTFSSILMLVRAYFTSSIQAGGMLRYFDDPSFENPFKALLAMKLSDFDPRAKDKGFDPRQSRFVPADNLELQETVLLTKSQIRALQELLEYYEGDPTTEFLKGDLNDSFRLLKGQIQRNRHL